MHVTRVRGGIQTTGAALSAVVLLALGIGADAFGAASASPHLGGTWSGKYSGAVSGTFTLHWTQTNSRLTGTIALSNPKGRYGVSGRVTSGRIKFGAVGVGATYTGTVSKSGLGMSGTWKSTPGGGSWSAHKVLTLSKPKVKTS